jgi:hypothetical protein
MKIKTEVDHIFKLLEPLVIVLFLWTILSTATGSHKLDWFDAAFLIVYALGVRKKNEN